MDTETAAYYATHAGEVAARYERVASPVERYFASAFPAGSRVLDVGCGSGRDLARLCALGYDAYGAEPVDDLRQEAIRHHPELGVRIVSGGLPDIGSPFGGEFDGILCSAVLMHLPEGALFDAAFALRRMLRPHGRLLVSTPLQRGEELKNDRDAGGRIFTPIVPEELQLLLERIGFHLIGRWDSEDGLGRAGTRWSTQLFELHIGSALRASDQIEGILNRDRKVATYKLALFRALAEIAMQESHAATWRADGSVAVPINRIAERWLLYYWPIFAGSFVPQSQDEGAGVRNPLRFRRALTDLIAGYRHAGDHGGLSAWHLDRTAGHLSEQSQTRLTAALREIATAIRTGPVTYSGGALDTGRVFGWDSSQRAVTMSADLWRELSLLGHWIVDAVIVRWAALTERFAERQGICSGDVLPLLLAKPIPERATALARQIYLATGIDRCIWTGQPLGRQFDIDHVIPFSLWGNNDLWNLVPATKKANREKSDKLPAADLLEERRAEIISAWTAAREVVPSGFDRQALQLLGLGGSAGTVQLPKLFARLREAVELTAQQRGVERWMP
ncbi:MAG: methyltransferase domain-containing protein [Betaproteobacteria bacterium]|nr:methyltransferase domain-containing protein [Betaproteobacteria bacterium]